MISKWARARRDVWLELGETAQIAVLLSAGLLTILAALYFRQPF